MMRRLRHIYPGITRAAVDMAYANGGVNRDRSESTVVRQLARFMDTVDLDPRQLRDIDKWFVGLSEDDLMTATDGEETEMLDLMKKGPPFAYKLLCDIWDGSVI